MKNSFILLSFLLFVFFTACFSDSKKKEKSLETTVIFVEDSLNKRVDAMVDGKLFTSYQWPENVCKPVLYPICTAKGTEITRGFPINPKPGERTDHPHQIGMWLTYGNVNGYDFWGNGSKGLGTKNENGGVIKHLSIDKKQKGKDEGILVTSSAWIAPTGEELMREHSEYHFLVKDSIRIIDRITTLTAKTDITMPDTKEGMFGIRVARELELPSKEDVTLYSADGEATKVEALSNEHISGNYLSSEGVTGEAVWGTRAKWMNLFGNIGDEEISVIICDHPENPNYPTYWHARGYGLFAANPLGVNDFTEGKTSLNFYLKSGQSTTFKYRVIISSDLHLTNDEINVLANDFVGKY